MASWQEMWSQVAQFESQLPIFSICVPIHLTSGSQFTVTLLRLSGDGKMRGSLFVNYSINHSCFILLLRMAAENMILFDL